MTLFRAGDVILSMMGLVRVKALEKALTRIEPRDFSGIPTAGCPVCGDQWLKVPMVFDDETYDVAAWGTDGECYSCGTRVTVCCPADKEQEANYEY
jgi:hypothetical protein